MSISDVIVVIEKKCDMFWRVDVMRSTQKKKIIKIRPQIKNRQGGGGQKPPPPPPGQPPNLKDVNIPRVKKISGNT